MNQSFISKSVQQEQTAILLGSNTKNLNAKMIPYISNQFHGYNVINLIKCSKLIIAAGNFLEKINKNEGKILFVGTNKIFSKLIIEYAKKTNSFYIVSRWLGGTLTNWVTIKGQIERLKNLEKEFLNPNFKLISKKIQTKKLKIFLKLSYLFEGIKDMNNLPNVVIFINQNKNLLGVEECLELGIPTISILDTNFNDKNITYPIIANTESYWGIKFILNYLTAKALPILKTKNS